MVIDDDDSETAEVSDVAKVSGRALTGSTTSTAGSSPVSVSQAVIDCSTGVKAIEKMVSDMFGDIASVSDRYGHRHNTRPSLSHSLKFRPSLASSPQLITQQWYCRTYFIFISTAT